MTLETSWWWGFLTLVKWANLCEEEEEREREGDQDKRLHMSSSARIRVHVSMCVIFRDSDSVRGRKEEAEARTKDEVPEVAAKLCNRQGFKFAFMCVLCVCVGEQGEGKVPVHHFGTSHAAALATHPFFFFNTRSLQVHHCPPPPPCSSQGNTSCSVWGWLRRVSWYVWDRLMEGDF